MISNNKLPYVENFRKQSELFFSNLNDFFKEKNDYKGLSFFKKIELLNSYIETIKQNTSSTEERAICKLFHQSPFSNYLKYFFEQKKENTGLPVFSFNEINYTKKIQNSFNLLQNNENERRCLFSSFRLLDNTEEINIGTLFLNMAKHSTSQNSSILYQQLIHEDLKESCVNKLILIESKIDFIDSIERSKNKYEGVFSSQNPLLNNLIIQSHIDKSLIEFSTNDLELFKVIHSEYKEREHSHFITQTAQHIQKSNEQNKNLIDKMENILHELNELSLEHQNYIKSQVEVKPTNTFAITSKVVIKPVKKIEIPEPNKIIDFSRLVAKDRLRNNLLKQIEKNKIKNKKTI